MVSIIGIRENVNSFNDLKAKFNLQQTEDDFFFTEWYENLPELTEEETASLNQIKQRYNYHRADRPLLEGTVNLLVVAPLLAVAGFLDPPFQIRSPESVEITIEDPVETLRGLIDVLVVNDRLWILVIEAKRTGIPLPSALPQILAYMMTNPHQDKPVFGMATNGDSFIFLKLSKQPTPQYDVSDSFLLLPRRNKFYDVLRILKRLAQITT